MKLLQWFRDLFSAERQLEKLDQDINRARDKGVPVNDLANEAEQLRRENQSIKTRQNDS